MNNYKYDVQYSNQFKKGLKKSLKQGKDINKLLDIVDKLANMEKLERKFKNHKLVNDKYYIVANELLDSLAKEFNALSATLILIGY